MHNINLGFQKQKAQKSIFSCNVYKTNHESRPTFPARHNSFKSTSFSGNCLWNEPEILYVNEKILSQPPQQTQKFSEIVRECGTQTSKTILQLANMEKGYMSPDSLTTSPRHETPTRLYKICSSLENNCPCSVVNYKLSDYSLEGSCQEQDSDGAFNNCKTHTEPCLSLLPEGDKPLTRTFLEKNKNRPNQIQIPKKEDLWMSQLRTTTPRPAKSKSFVDQYQNNSFDHPNFIRELPQEVKITPPVPSHNTNRPRATRLSSKSLDLPDNSFIRRRSSSLYPPLQHSSFMCPTASSQIKSKLAEIQSVNELIPPVRRGRSTSPKPSGDRRRFESSRKIPYIDQSKSDVSSATTIVNLTRNPERFPKSMFEDDTVDVDDIRDLSEENLPLYDRPEPTVSMDCAISNAVGKLRDPDWRVALRGLADIVEVCRIVDLEQILDFMISINQRLIELLRSPRSHVCRTACQAAGHLFEYVKDTRKPEFDDIVDILLFKTADANKFIRQDANLALDCMVTHVSTYNAVRALCARGPFHKNHLVRCATARLLVCTVVIAGPDFILNPNNNEFTRKRVILNMTKFLEDKNLETRKFAERLYKVLSKESRFDVYLKKYLDREKMVKIKTNLKLIHKK